MGHVPLKLPTLIFRHATVECAGCGAAVHPRDEACTYCLTTPEGDAPDLIEVTTIDDPVRRYVKTTLGAA